MRPQSALNISRPEHCPTGSPQCNIVLPDPTIEFAQVADVRIRRHPQQILATKLVSVN